jgi:DNA polymerase
MSDSAQVLRSLITELKEHVTYFQELGVLNLDESAASTEPVLKPAATNNPGIADSASAPIPSPLTRNARAAANAEMRSRGESPPEVFSDAGSESLFESIAVNAKTLASSPTETLEEIWADIGQCTRCPLHEGRTHVVNSEGNRRARLMFVGEAPGADEDIKARPFVGKAGQLLEKIIAAIGLKREDVFIGNVNRCRPPQNRAPLPDEAATCKPFLLREIAAIQPRVIVVLGNTAMKNLLGSKEGITRARGRFQDFMGIKVMPTFHPAYLLRDPSKKRETWDDMKRVREYLNSVAAHE